MAESIPTMRLPAPALFAERRKNAAQATGFIWPVSGRVTQTPGEPGTHAHADAYDIAAAYGTPIIAPEGARVKKIILPSKDNPYGLNVILSAGDTEIRLAHMSSLFKGLAVGQTISQNQIIGYVGSTGNSTGPHLHLEFLNPQDRPEAPGTYKIPGVTQAPSVGQQVSQILGFGEISAPSPDYPNIRVTSSGAVVNSPVSADIVSSDLSSPAGTVTGSGVQSVTPATRQAPLVGVKGPRVPANESVAQSQNQIAADNPASQTAADQGQILLQTPLGPVRAPVVNWIRVGAFIGGGAILLIGLAGISRGTQKAYYGAQLKAVEAIPGGAGIAGAIRGKDLGRASREVGRLHE
jgi:hypothetical protein